VARVNETNVIHVHSQIEKGADLGHVVGDCRLYFQDLVQAIFFLPCACLESVFLPFLPGQSGCILLQDHLEQAFACIGWICHLGPFWGITANPCLHSSTHTTDLKASAITTSATTPPLISFPL
jgi:hypothetical protein